MMDIPEKYRLIVGTTVKMSGPLFSYKKRTEETEFQVIGIRWGTATVINLAQYQQKRESDVEHPTVEYLVKNDSMKRSRWTNGILVEEINLIETRPKRNLIMGTLESLTQAQL